MGDWLALDGIVARDSLGLFAACAAITLCVAWAAARLSVSSMWAVIAVCVGAAGLTVGWPVSKSADSLGLLSLSPTYVRAGMVAGWDWTTNHVVDSVVAYSGNNVPYPLFGEHLSNSARYINIDRHSSWRFHDYARARGKGRARGALACAAFGTAHAAGWGQFRGLETAIRTLGRRPRRLGRQFACRRSVASVRYRSSRPMNLNSPGTTKGAFPSRTHGLGPIRTCFRLIFENGQVRVYSLAHP